ncbi:MAG TPA: hypothetical protein VIM57_04880 [Luteolibacter sp.]
MKALLPIILSTLLAGSLTAQEIESAPAAPVTSNEQHRQGSEKLSGEQDELAADVQQLAIEQTVPKVIELLKECEDLMGEATERLSNHDTGGETISAQTEVIEKIHAAAKARQEQSGGGGASGAMMDMLERVMGKQGDQGGKGKTGLSDTANAPVEGEGSGKTEERRIPKATGAAGKGLPEEFRQALDAYNRGAEQLSK